MQPINNISGNEFYFQAKNMLAEKKSIEDVKKFFAEQGIDDNDADLILSKIKKEIISKRVSKGFMFIFIGAFTLLLSCILTFGSQFNHYSFTFVLYGLTTIGAAFVITGLAMIFG